MNARIVQGKRYGGAAQRPEVKLGDNRVRVPWPLLERLTARANREGKDVQEVVAEALGRYLDGR